MQLEDMQKDAQQQQQYIRCQLEQLEGCEGGADSLDVSDLQRQLKVITLASVGVLAAHAPHAYLSFKVCNFCVPLWLYTCTNCCYAHGMQLYEDTEQDAAKQLQALDKEFEVAVAEILDVASTSTQLEAAVQQQQNMVGAQVLAQPTHAAMHEAAQGMHKFDWCDLHQACAQLAVFACVRWLWSEATTNMWMIPCRCSEWLLSSSWDL